MKTNKKLKGTSIDIASINMAFFGSADPDCPNISKEQLEQMWDKAMPKLKKDNIGRVIITSTASNNSGIEFKKLWENGK